MGNDCGLRDAAAAGDVASVRQLILQGADPDALNHDPEVFSAVRMAVGENHVACLGIMLLAGADANQIDAFDGLTPLLAAAHKGHVDCLRLLLLAGAVPMQTASEDCECYLRGFQRERFGKTALDIAKENGHADCVALLNPFCEKNFGLAWLVQSFLTG
eukprot:TRINITY_DN80652_c0_g1_i1.p1 TRINITY_DN80652_c0_g1~~TRINITY_DN80652_c0_g1_i1.p1  ORF type:complete len:159 (+),score=33.29 TRINITY_DN80652_c0_g1_i1:51-527(+)